MVNIHNKISEQSVRAYSLRSRLTRNVLLKDFERMRCANRSVCVFCGGDLDGSHDDHIPGRQFFPLPRPIDLITVPAHADCNSRFKTDEDYVRAILLATDAGKTAFGDRLWQQKAKRALEKDKGLNKAFFRSVKNFAVFTPEGLPDGNRLGLDPDWKRVSAFVEKLVRGLYWFEYKSILPQALHIDFPRGFAEDFPGTNPYLTLTSPGNRSWPGIFEYRAWRGPVNPERSSWVFVFYGTNMFVAATCRPDDPMRRSRTTDSTFATLSTPRMPTSATGNEH